MKCLKYIIFFGFITAGMINTIDQDEENLAEAMFPNLIYNSQNLPAAEWEAIIKIPAVYANAAIKSLAEVTGQSYQNAQQQLQSLYNIAPRQPQKYIRPTNQGNAMTQKEQDQLFSQTQYLINIANFYGSVFNSQNLRKAIKQVSSTMQEYNCTLEEASCYLATEFKGCLPKNFAPTKTKIYKKAVTK